MGAAAFGFGFALRLGVVVDGGMGVVLGVLGVLGIVGVLGVAGSGGRM